MKGLLHDIIYIFSTILIVLGILIYFGDCPSDSTKWVIPEILWTENYMIYIGTGIITIFITMCTDKRKESTK